MAITALTNAKLYVAQFDLSGDHNQLALDVGVQELIATVFGDTAERVRGGLGLIELTGQGFVSFGTGNVHEALRANINVADVPVTIAAESGDDGEYAEFFKARIAQYRLGAPVGQLLPFTVAASAQGQLPIQGTILGTGAKTATANGTGRQFTAPTATKSIFAALHVLSVSGTTPTLDVVITSDDNSGFTSATTRLTFAQKTAVGSEFLTAAGPFAGETWWRAQWTIGGTGTPTFSVVIVFGIADNASA